MKPVNMRCREGNPRFRQPEPRIKTTDGSRFNLLGEGRTPHVRPALCPTVEKERRHPVDDLLMTAVASERWPEQISGLT